MATVTNFIFCENSKIDENGNTSVVNILNYFSLSILPTQFTFDLYFTVAKFETGDHKIKFIMLDSDNNILAETPDINVKLLKTSDTIDDVNFVNFTLNLRNILFKKEGECIAKIFFDDELIGEKHIYANKKWNLSIYSSLHFKCY